MMLCQFPDLKSIILTASHTKRRSLFWASLPRNTLLQLCLQAVTGQLQEGEQKVSPFPYSCVNAAHNNLLSEMQGLFIPGCPTPEF